MGFTDTHSLHVESMKTRTGDFKWDFVVHSVKRRSGKSFERSGVLDKTLSQDSQDSGQV